MDPCQWAEKASRYRIIALPTEPFQSGVTVPPLRRAASILPDKETENVVEGEKRTFWGDCGQGRDARSRADYK